MKDGNDCNETFPQGITNGAYWYDLSGGMQDFNYVFTNCFEITLELSCCKFPSRNELPTEWHKNKKSLIEYIKMTHIGLKGLVKDVNGYPISDAEVYVQGVEAKPVRTTERGEYWRLLTPGTYNVRAIAFGWVLFFIAWAICVILSCSYRNVIDPSSLSLLQICSITIYWSCRQWGWCCRRKLHSHSIWQRWRYFLNQALHKQPKIVEKTN